MTFANIPHGIDLFVDANTFIYHFTADAKHGAPCTELVERIERRELRGFATSHLIADVAHRLMTIEAMQRLNWPATRLAARLRKHYIEIPHLTLYEQAVAGLRGIGLVVLPITEVLVDGALALIKQHSLLMGDALVVAVMQAHRLTHLASADTDFDRVPGIARYEPG